MAARDEGEPEPARAARLAKIRLLALDVDGCLTDGRITYGAAGQADETPSFDVQDGIAIRWMHEAGVVVAWISGRGSPAVTARARELEVREVHLSAGKKREVLRGIQERLGIALEETAAMGDDLPDLGLRARSAFFAAPANGRAEVRERADLVLERPGGRGAVRELCEEILRAKGRWQSIVDGAER